MVHCVKVHREKGLARENYFMFCGFMLESGTSSKGIHDNRNKQSR